MDSPQNDFFFKKKYISATERTDKWGDYIM